MLLQARTESAAAAKAILGTLKDFSAIILIMIFAMFRQMFLWRDDYSTDERLTLATTITGGIALLLLTMILNIEVGHILTVMKSRPAWAAFVIALATVTVTAAIVTWIRHFRESQKLYGIGETDIPTQSRAKWSAQVMWVGFFVWFSSCGVVIYWLWRISKGQ